MNKTKIKNFSIWARRNLIEVVAYRMRFLGIDENGITPEMEGSTDKLKLYNMGTSKPAEVADRDISKRIRLANHIKDHEKTSDYKTAYETVVEEIAYTWFNRLIAIRFMEVNDYLPSGVRVLSSESGKREPDIVTQAVEVAEDQGFSISKDDIWRLKDENKLDELFRIMFIQQCKKLSEVLPELFDNSQDDYTELLLPISFIDDDAFIRHLVTDIDEADFNLSEQGQVEIIGWLYQYYNSEKKDSVFEAMKKKVKVSKENIAAATQLFTPDWIVRYMVENSLGRLWVDGHADTSARSEWKYYLDEAEQTPEVQAQLAEIRAGRKDLTPEQIRFIDPCMGSGHILVYAFDVLMQIYLSCGYTERDAAQNIVRNNLWGLDLDKRAYQLAYFAVMMKARQYDRRFLTRGIKPNLSHFQDLPVVNYDLLDEPIKSFAVQFENADTYGSLISVKADNGIDEALDKYEQRMFIGDEEQIEYLMQLYKMLSQRYDVVCTNPPYMAMANANAVLKNYVDKNYPDSKSDMFAVFMEKCAEYAKKDGYYSMITQHAWMTLSSYQKLRHKLQSKTTINMAHLGARAFDEISGEIVQTTAFVNANTNINNYFGIYRRLVDGANETEKRDMFIQGKNTYTANAHSFYKIPDEPIAYWVSETVSDVFYREKSLSEVSAPKQGLATTDNNKFVRFWQELPFQSIGFGMTKVQAAESGIKWFPLCKGGEYRKWFGNNTCVVNYQNDGAEIKSSVLKKYTYLKTPDFVVKNQKFYFMENGTWSAISGREISVRYSPLGFVISNAGMAVYSDQWLKYIIAFMNTKLVSLTLLPAISQTLNFNAGDIERLPIVLSEKYYEQVNQITEDCIRLSKEDWDSFETSWDFKEHPFVKWSKELWDATAIGASMQHYYGGHPEVSCQLELCYLLWQGECNDRRAKLKANEEELNRIFIEIYGLQDELTPDVDDKDITVRAADLQRDMRSFVSYAVGCMFGRYSLDTEGLAYAGGEWDESKYRTFKADKDNIIPICDDEYFDDDMTGLFIQFVKTVFGEESLEENLKYIADALGGKGNPKTVIRNYFLKDFYSDHCKTYQKRPIYWLFDSGKKNGFKALIYMHRYQPDTIARIRNDYVHEQQSRYRTAIADVEKRLSGAKGSEAVKLNKELDKLNYQADELITYEEKIHHLADQMIKIDLDDGVKHNYEIFKDVLAKVK